MKEEEFIRAVSHIDMSADERDRMKEKLIAYQKTTVVTEHGGGKMLKKKRLGGLIAVAVLALSITAFAATGIVSSWYASSSSRPDYRTLPTAEQVRKDIGYDVVLIDQFSNGYTFHNGSIVSNKLEDEDQQAVEQFKSVDFRYQKGKDEVDFSQDRYTSQMETQGIVVDSVGDTEITYFSCINKIVPPDYKLSAEEKAAEENGELVFSYGSDKVELVTWQSVSWQIGEMHYQLFQEVDKDSLTQEELVAMAKEAIAGK